MASSPPMVARIAPCSTHAPGSDSGPAADDTRAPACFRHVESSTIEIFPVRLAAPDRDDPANPGPPPHAAAKAMTTSMTVAVAARVLMCADCPPPTQAASGMSLAMKDPGTGTMARRGPRGAPAR
jgi:hypothetical protein